MFVTGTDSTIGQILFPASIEVCDSPQETKWDVPTLDSNKLVTTDNLKGRLDSQSYHGNEYCEGSIKQVPNGTVPYS